MTRYLKNALAMLLLCSPFTSDASPQMPSGITLSQFRIIYSQSDAKGVTWSLTNNSDRAYLMQSWIRPMDFTTGLPLAEEKQASPKKPIPLLVTPPLNRVDSGEALTLRIRALDDSLPKDRESVFYLSVKGIPSIPDKATQTGGQLVVAVVNNVKLFYRPTGLPEGGVTQAASRLRFSRKGETLVVTNPTPFYLNFSQLTVGGKALPTEALRRLVPPQGQQDYPLDKSASGVVEWQLVDETSQATPTHRQTL